MVTIDMLIERLQSVQLDTMVEESITETEKEFVALQTEQLFSGKLNDGAPIEPSYAASTVRIKKKKGQPYDRVTTRDTNEYHNTMRAFPDGSRIAIGSDKDYEQYLDQRYSQKLYGLTPDNTGTYAFGPFWEALKKRLEEKTKLAFNGQ